MAELNQTPSGNRTHIAFFGLRNAGKSTLVNALTGQEIAIVSDVAGTTTDPVSKAMEILPLGPCMITDTAGLDDVGALGEERVRRTLEVLEKTDVAVWVDGSIKNEELRIKNDESLNGRAQPFRQAATCTSAQYPTPNTQYPTPNTQHPAPNTHKWFTRFSETCRQRNVPVIVYRRGESVDDLKKRIAAIKLADAPRPLISDLLSEGDMVVCVCPIDESAPKGRLILPQQQVIREIIDAGASALVCQPAQLNDLLEKFTGKPCEAIKNEELRIKNIESPITNHQSPIKFVITDSQAFGEVSKVMPPEIPLTSFSIVFARTKGDLEAYCAGAGVMRNLKEGDKVLIAEGCTHHRQCNDIGTVKLPRWVEQYAGCKLQFEFCAGNAFPDDLSPYALVIQCGGCMLTRRAVQSRIERCRSAGVPITNYGIAIAACHGIHAAPDTCMVIKN